MRDFLFSYILGIAIYNRDTLSLVEATESDSGLNMGYTPYLSRYYNRQKRFQTMGFRGTQFSDKPTKTGIYNFE